LENLKEITHTGTPENGVWSPFDELTEKKKKMPLGGKIPSAEECEGHSNKSTN
jgi:hypothetical protein